MKTKVSARGRGATSALRLSHLNRELKTALELAIAALAPTQLVDALATAAGLGEALAQFPDSAAPVLANRARVLQLSESALADWNHWQLGQRRKKGTA